MRAVLLDQPVREWVCPSCGLVERSKGQANRWHPCPRQKGMTVPLVLQGTAAKHVLVEREDYEGEDVAQKDEDGRAIMSILTIRDEGQDCTVLPPTAILGGSS